MTPVKQDLLSLLAVTNPGIDQLLQIHRFLSADSNLDRKIDAFVHEGLGGLLYKNLLKSGAFEILDGHHQEKLRSLYYRSVRFNLLLINDLKKLLRILNQKNIRVLLLQGISLLNQIYDDIGLRPLSDIDLWILEKEYPALKSVLLNQGYNIDPLYPLTFKKELTTIDLHTHILWADRIKTRDFLLSKSQDEIFQKTRTIDFDGREASGLDPFDQVIYLCLHTLKHNAERLIWLVDIHRLVVGWDVSDWSALMGRSKELGQEKSIAYICFLLQHLMGFHLPETIMPTQNKLTVLEKKVLKRRIRKGALPRWSSLFLLTSGKKMNKRFAFILETLFPRPDILRQVFPDSESSGTFGLYLKRTRQLFGMLNTK